MVNDLSIFAISFTILLLTAVFVQPIADEFGVDTGNFDEDNYVQGIKEDTKDVGIIDLATIGITIFKLSTFDVGNSLGLPYYVDIFFVIISVIVLLFGVRLIRGN